MRNIADKVKVTLIEEQGDGAHMKVHVESPNMTITETTYISTMPLHSGQTDLVPGQDGQILNDGKHSFKIQGVEDGIGAYFINVDEIMYKETAEKTILYNRDGGSYQTELENIQSEWKEIAEFTSAGSADIWIGEEVIDIATGSTFVETIGGGSANGVGDRYYWGSTETGLREKLERGGLGFGSGAGLSCVGAGLALSSAAWRFAPCV